MENWHDWNFFDMTHCITRWEWWSRIIRTGLSFSMYAFCGAWGLQSKYQSWLATGLSTQQVHFLSCSHICESYLVPVLELLYFWHVSIVCCNSVVTIDDVTLLSGLPIVVKQDGCEQIAAGQTDTHEQARSMQPLLFSYADRESPYLCTMRLGRKVQPENLMQGRHGSRFRGFPVFCERFSTDGGSCTRGLKLVSLFAHCFNQVISYITGKSMLLFVLEVFRQALINFRSVEQSVVAQHTSAGFVLTTSPVWPPQLTDDGAPNREFYIGISVRRGWGRYLHTHIVTIAPRYLLVNKTTHRLCVAQRHATSYSSDTSGSTLHLTVMTGRLSSTVLPLLLLHQNLMNICEYRLILTGEKRNKLFV